MRTITYGNCDTAEQTTKRLQQGFDTHVSAQAVRNVLKTNGLQVKHKVKKPAISVRNQKKRLMFAKKYQRWTVKDSKRVIWSDEAKTNRFGSDD